MAERVCPFWVGYLLANPLRRLWHSPDTILAPHVRAGMTVLDAGCAMGFFSLPLARLVGAGGKVVCVDVQEKMVRSLQRRAVRAGLADRIVTQTCGPDSLGLKGYAGKMDFALTFAVAHEVPNPSAFFREIVATMRADATCLVAEPKGRVSAEQFERTVSVAEGHGMKVAGRPRIRGCRAALLTRQ